MEGGKAAVKILQTALQMPSLVTNKDHSRGYLRISVPHPWCLPQYTPPILKYTPAYSSAIWAGTMSYSTMEKMLETKVPAFVSSANWAFRLNPDNKETLTAVERMTGLAPLEYALARHLPIGYVPRKIEEKVGTMSSQIVMIDLEGDEFFNEKYKATRNMEPSYVPEHNSLTLGRVILGEVCRDKPPEYSK